MRRSPEEILFTDDQGGAATLEDVIADGMEGEYADRIPSLIELLGSGSPYHRLMACIVLTSWGHPAGFEAIVRWASNPGGTPWAEGPVTVDRIYGTDDAFESLADALKTSYWNAETAELQNMQREAAEALLTIYHLSYFGQTLALALVKDPVWKTSKQSKIAHTLETCLQTIASGKRPGFDLSYQTACLLLVLAPANDILTAEISERLIAQCAENDRTLRELALALGYANGLATLRTLDELKRLSRPSVVAEVDRALTLRQERASTST
ncbi:MAG: hypothetical protein MJE77_18340 [Proteobacteria bacterium]|nr:hypothetical protein [Pseudomonadota bacterium]